MTINRLMDENMVFIYNGKLFSHKNNERMIGATTRMDLEIIILSEKNHQERQISYDICCMWKLETKDKNELI